MADRALSWPRAAAIAWRDLKSAPGKFAFVVLSVAVGVAALVGVRGFSESFRTTLMTEARSLMAGDLSARVFRQPSAEESQKLSALEKGIPGSDSTWVTETVSMASVPPDPVPILVTLKAVDPTRYPFYGSAQLEPAMSLRQALEGDSAVVAEEFLIRLNAHVGQSLRLGGKNFKIVAVLAQEPDRISAGAGMGPRVMVSRASLENTGLLAPGSRAAQRLLLKLPATADDAAVRKQVESILPDAQVMDFKEGNPALSQGLDNATAILSLICLVAMVLGAIGVAMAMHAHLEQRMDMLAILKAVGASSSDLLRIFLLQTLALGLVGALIGVAGGAAVMEALPAVFGKLLPVHTVMHFPWRAVACRPGHGTPYDTFVLSSTTARCARRQAHPGFATVGRTRAKHGQRMVCTLVVAPIATRHRFGRHRCAGCNRMGAFRFCKSGRVVRACCSRSRWWFFSSWRRLRSVCCDSF